MTSIQINGSYFQTATEWAVDRVTLNFTDNPDVGPDVIGLVAYDPLGPNAGSTDPSITVDSWTDSTIELSFDYHAAQPGSHVSSVLVEDVTNTYSLAFDVDPDQIILTPPLALDLVYNIGTDTLELTAPTPLFSTWNPGTDQVSISGTGGPGTAGTNNAIKVNPHDLHIFPGVASTLPYATITQVTYEHPAGNVIATWVGSIPGP